MNFENVLRFLSEYLNQEKIDHALIGGLALGAYGITRVTVDLDILTHLDHRDGIVRFLESLGYETLSKSEAFSNHLHPMPEMGRIDFVYVTGSTAETVLREARDHVIFTDQKIKVIKAEHMIAMKLFAMASDPSRTHREMEDIRNLLALDGVNREETKGYFEKYASLATYGKLLEDLE